jgi:hypothetical protein
VFSLRRDPIMALSKERGITKPITLVRGKLFLIGFLKRTSTTGPSETTEGIYHWARL